MAVFHVKLDPEIRFMDKRDEIKGIFGQKKETLNRQMIREPEGLEAE